MSNRPLCSKWLDLNNNEIDQPILDIKLKEDDYTKFELFQYNDIIPQTKYFELCEIFGHFDGKINRKTNGYIFPIEKHDQLIEKVKMNFGETIIILSLINKSIKLYLFDKYENEYRFQIKTYQVDLLRKIFELNSIEYVLYANRLVFLSRYYVNVLKVLKQKCPQCLTAFFPSGFSKFIGNSLNKNNFFDKIDLENRLCGSIFENLNKYQIDGVCFGINRNGRFILADDMGLGKTFQSLAIATFFDKWPLLIVTTKTGCIVWQEEIKKWLTNYLGEKFPKLNYDQIVYTVENEFDSRRRAQIYICNYNVFKMHYKEFRNGPIKFKFFIIDESQYIKNKLAQRTLDVSSFCHKIDHVILLSGTPAYSNPSELYTQINAIDSSLFKNAHEYEKRYCDAHLDMWYHWNIKGHSNLKELKVIMHDNILLRREKSDYPDLFPKKQREIIEINARLEDVEKKLSKHRKKYLYYRKKEKLDLYDKKFKKSLHSKKRHHYMKSSYKWTAKAKSFTVCSYVKNVVLNQKDKLIVVAYHLLMLDDLEEMCLRNKLDYIRIDGSTSSEDRQERLNKYRQDSNCKIAILTFYTLGGLTLTEAKLIIMAEIYWTPGILLQAEDRIFRIGQNGVVNVEYLIAINTIDPYIWNIVNNKLNVLGQMGLSNQVLPTLDNMTQLIDEENDDLSDLSSSDDDEYYPSDFEDYETSEEEYEEDDEEDLSDSLSNPSEESEIEGSNNSFQDDDLYDDEHSSNYHSVATDISLVELDQSSNSKSEFNTDSQTYDSDEYDDSFIDDEEDLTGKKSNVKRKTQDNEESESNSSIIILDNQQVQSPNEIHIERKRKNGIAITKILHESDSDVSDLERKKKKRRQIKRVESDNE